MAAIAAGVVAHTETLIVSDHPVCGAKVGFAENFLDAAASPPHEEGNSSHAISNSEFSYILSTLRGCMVLNVR